MAKAESNLITDAPDPASEEAQSRSKWYLILMGIRVLCFMVAFLIPGWPKWIVIAAAVILPGVAVMIANQPNQKKLMAQQPSDTTDTTTAALPDGDYDVIPGEVIDNIPATR